jgi:hypothetical protein
MNLKLKFVTEIVRPFEVLNQSLIQQNSIDSDVSDYIAQAEMIAIRLNHLPEIANKKHLRGHKDCPAYQIIIDLANSRKHGVNTKALSIAELSVSAMFEYKDEKYRFIRNALYIIHPVHGRVDFLKLVIETAEFISLNLGLNIFWNPEIREAESVFTENPSLLNEYKNQISYNAFQIQIFKRNKNGDLEFFDPPNISIQIEEVKYNFTTFSDYIFFLLNNSISHGEYIDLNPIFDLKESEQSIQLPFAIIGRFVIGVNIFNDDQFLTVNEVKYWESILAQIKMDEVILIVRTELSDAVKKYICQETNKIYVVKTQFTKATNLPINFFRKTINQNNISVTKIQNFTLNIKQEDEHHFRESIDLNKLGNVFSRDRENLLSPMSLISSFINPKMDELSGTKKIHIKPTDQQDIFIKINNKFVKVGMSTEIDWIVKTYSIKAPILSFESYINGISIWNLHAFINLNKIETEVTLKAIKYGNTSAIGLI